jgi:uncharacterized protein
VRFEFVLETAEIGNADRLRIAIDIAFPECWLMFEERVVHLPEHVLFAGSLCRFGGKLGIRVNGAQGKFVKCDAQTVAESLFEPLDYRIGRAAKRALEIGKLDERYRSVFRPPNVSEGLERHIHSTTVTRAQHSESATRRVSDTAVSRYLVCLAGFCISCFYEAYANDCLRHKRALNAVGWIEDFVLGAVLGGLGGLLGIGGGLIAIPVLVLVYHYNQQTAQGTALVMIVPNVVVGLWRYHKAQKIDLRVAVLLGLSSVIMTYIFVRIATQTEGRTLRTWFAVFILLVAIDYAWRVLREGEGPTKTTGFAWGWTAVVGVLGGILSGLFGVGGATIAPPLLTTLFGYTQKQAQGLALALVTPGAVVALATYAAANDVRWSTGIPLAIGGITTVSAGVTLAHRLPEKQLRLLFCALLVAVAILLFIQ